MTKYITPGIGDGSSNQVRCQKEMQQIFVSLHNFESFSVKMTQEFGTFIVLGGLLCLAGLGASLLLGLFPHFHFSTMVCSCWVDHK